jgi:3-deoxy-D-manno-octulosonic-acid transferase
MPYLLDLVYLICLLLLSPWLIYKSLTTGKYRRGLAQKALGQAVSPYPRTTNEQRTVWFHGVSVGEIHLLRPVVRRFRQRFPECACVISTTTDTGYVEARKHFADLPVFYWPFDFSWAVRRTLRAIRPSLVVLAEGELWPNFLITAKRLGVPVAVINGRMSPRSFRRYLRMGALARRLVRGISVFAVQTEEYAACFRSLGAVTEQVFVTGSVKYDGVNGDRDNLKTRELRRLLAVESSDLVWIAGSTQAPEEEIVLDIYCRLKVEHSNLRLILVPRQKERFDVVAEMLRRSGLPFVRRSLVSEPVTSKSAVILVDTIGELGALWGLADVAFVGGSLDGRRGGQNMIEPAAYGAAVVFGPHVWNFRDTASRLVENEAAQQVTDAASLETVVRELLSHRSERDRLGTAARQFVQGQQGATERTLAVLEPFLAMRPLAKAS